MRAAYGDKKRASFKDSLADDNFAVRELLNQGGYQLLIILLDVASTCLEQFG